MSGCRSDPERLPGRSSSSPSSAASSLETQLFWHFGSSLCVGPPAAAVMVDDGVDRVGIRERPSRCQLVELPEPSTKHSYFSRRSVMMRSQENIADARSNAAFVIASRCSGFDSNCRIPSARARTSERSTRKPLRPSSTISEKAPPRVATIDVPLRPEACRKTLHRSMETQKCWRNDNGGRAR